MHTMIDLKVQKWLGQLRWILLSGFSVSCYLLLLHIRYDEWGASCNIGDMFSCSVLLIKTYSVWFGIPVPVYSIVFYGLCFALACFAYAKSSEDSPSSLAFLYILSKVALLATVGMAFIAFVKLKTVCIFCTILYVVSILFFVWMRKIFRQEKERRSGQVMDELLGVFKNANAMKISVICAAILAGSYFYFGSKPSEIQFDPSRSLVGRSLGNPNASVKVEVFSDFQCPACKAAGPFLYTLEKELGSQIHLTYKYYPLNSKCNTSAMFEKHRQACNAAVASFCASLQNKFWRYHDILYHNQRALSDSTYVQIAKVEGLKLQEFSQCLKSEEALNAVKSDAAQGALYNVQGTPSIFINGKLFQGRRTVEEFKKAMLEVQ